MKKLEYSFFSFLVLLLGLMVFSSCQKEPVVNLTEILTLEETDELQAKPTVKFKFGIGLVPYKPNRKCLRGWGVCRINFIFIEISWTKSVYKGDIGIDPDTGKVIIIYDSNFEEIEAMVAGDPLMHIEQGDEVIDVDEETLAYFGLSEINLIPGDYEVFLNEEGRFQVEIDAELID